MTVASTIIHPRAALEELVAGLSDPANHYIVKAHSYELDGLTWYLAVIYLNQAIVWNVNLADDTFSCDALLSRNHLQSKSRIKITCNQVWSIYSGLNSKCDSDDNCLYFDSEILAKYPLSAECV